MNAFIPPVLFLMLVFTRGIGIGAPEKSGTRIVRDCYGREVTIPEKVNRIACLYAFSGHVVTMLGRGNDIVAVVRGLKRDVLLTRICPSIRNAAVPNLNDALNMEELARQKPDVVFIKDTVAGKKSETEMLNRLGMPYVVIAFENIEEQMKAVGVIGGVIGNEKESGEYNTYYRECIERTKNIVRKIPNEKRLKLYHSILEPLKTDGPDSVSAEWTKLSGTVNVSVDDKNTSVKGDRFVNIEQVLLWNPDVIITHEDGAVESIRSSRQWSTIKAVKNNRVYRMPIGISRWGHPGSIETPLALLWTVKTVYPEYASSIDIRRATVYFYGKFFNYRLSDCMVEEILSGKGLRKSKNEDKR